MYNNPYMFNYGGNFNAQNMNDRIDSQIAQLQQMKEQLKNQQPAINQTFQLAPTNNNTIRFANNIDDVNKENVLSDTPFFSKDMSIMWLKNTKGNVKVYELTEIVPKDEKDIMIQSLQMQINEMKGMLDNAKSNDKHVDESNQNEKPSSVSNGRTSTKKSK